MAGKISKYGNLIEVTPTVTASSAYSSGQQVGGIMTLTSATLGQYSISQLSSLSVVDKASQSAALTIFFFDDLPTVASSDHATLDISGAEMADKCLGYVKIAAGDYQTTNSNSVATIIGASVGLSMKSQEANGTLYAVAKTTGTPTYASASDLVFKFSFIQD